MFCFGTIRDAISLAASFIVLTMFFFPTSIISNDLDQIRELFDEIEKKTTFIDILENAGNAKGVQIFIGSQNFLFKHSGLSMVMAPYKNKKQEIVGAIGVVGPTRLNYSKIVPLVDYTSKIIGKVVK